MADVCAICGDDVDPDDGRLIVVRGRRRQVCCSEACLRRDLRERRARRSAMLRRLGLGGLVVATSFACVLFVSLRYRAPTPHAIVYDPPERPPDPPPPLPPGMGPEWPPPDTDWMALFGRPGWTFPLPGPDRRAVVSDDQMAAIAQMAATAPNHSRGVRCRDDRRCGVNLGGQLWGEHVYAARDGIVDRVQRTEGGTGAGQYVRIAHSGQMVFTQYFHLAAIPSGLFRGVHVKSGEIIGLLGDTGGGKTHRHLHFTLSVRPSPAVEEVYWDPTPWMGNWPLRVPTNGSVAGLEGPDKRVEMPRRRQSRP